jgi:hypothetical protein
VFTRAMQDSRILAHIAAPTSRDVKAIGPQAGVLPLSAKKNAQELVRWVFGTEDSAPLLTDSRRISVLGTVLASKPALARLRTSENLDEAFDTAGGPQQQLIAQIERATAALDRSAALANELGTRIRSDEIAATVARCAKALKAVQIATS